MAIIDRSLKLRTAVVGTLAALGAGSAAAQSPSTAGAELAEITVTAQKRDQNAADIPFSVSALDTAALESMGAVRFEDFARSMPGLAFTLLGPGQSRFTIRGVSTFSGVSVVGLYLDESPVASTINYTQPSLALFDVERVELLRGPQGTLYGEGSLGGTLRYVTARPDFEAFGVKTEARLSNTEEGGTNWHVNGMVNVPLADGAAAIRLVGLHHDDSGFIDNLPLGRKDWNDTATDAARVKFGWKATDRLRFELGGLYQKIDQGGPGVESFDRPNESLQNNDTADQYYDDEIRQATLTTEYRFDAADLVAATAYFERTVEQGSQARGPSLANLPNYTLFDADFQVFTQEVRVTSRSEGPWRWIGGAFYKTYEVDELRRNFRVSPAGTPTTRNLRQSSFDQVAVFGELEYALTEQWFVTGGLRWFDEDQDAINNVGQRFSVDAQKVVPRVAVRFEPADGFNLYASYTEGFRSGGVNLFAIPGVDNTFKPDTTKNYELGAKSRFFAGRAAVDFAVYRIDWQDMQTFVARPDLGPTVFFVQNAASARVDGAELEARLAVAQGLEVGMTGAYSDARYTRDAPFEGPRGNRLPKVPEYTGSAYLSASRPFGSTTAYGRVDFQYVGTFPELGNNIDESGNYKLVNLRTGLAWDHVEAELFVDNATDARADLFQRRTTEFGMYRNRPRTYGVTLRWRM